MDKVKLDGGNITLIRGDCLEVMPKMKPGIIDLILADLPYGTTRNKWDSIIPLDVLWGEYKRIRKNNAAIVLTAQTPFDKVLGVSNLEELRYEWIWGKGKSTGFLNARKMPLKEHENVLVFYQDLPIYNPQGLVELVKPVNNNRKNKLGKGNYNQIAQDAPLQTVGNFPTSILEIKAVIKGQVHPTEKPIELMEYLIKTYTSPCDLVLDNTMGSGTTAVACINTNRRFVGIEKEQNYFDICIKRCEDALLEKDKRIAA